MEAEYFDFSSTTDSHSWVHAVLGNSSNDDAMVTTPPDEGQLAITQDNSPMLGYFWHDLAEKLKKVVGPRLNPFNTGLLRY